MSQFIIIGSGPGGTAAALPLLQQGHRVLMLERGDFLPKEPDNRSTQAVYIDRKYRTAERWSDGTKGTEGGDGEKFQPWMHYHVGGNAKLYGAALYRFRPGDFRETRYAEGVSPAWPLSYEDFAPYYDAAEALYTVCGNRAEDTTEPTARPYPQSGIKDEAAIAQLKRDLKIDTHTLALGVNPQSQNEWDFRFDKFDAYPDPSLGKSDPEARLLDKLRALGDAFELRTQSLVECIESSYSGTIRGVRLTSGERLTADVYILAAGAINSARILLQSALKHTSPLIGANYMAHLSTTGCALFDRDLQLTFAKTFGSNHWYRPDAPGPQMLGSIQTQGKWDAVQYGDEPWTRELGEPEDIANRCIEFFFMTEDLPLPENRITLQGDGLTLSRRLTNLPLHRELINKFESALKEVPNFKKFASSLMPIDWCTHQCGTLAFGEDPNRSVLDTNCRLHTSDQLYVCDASFFPSSSGLNPTLTVIANALRVGEHLAKI